MLVEIKLLCDFSEEHRIRTEQFWKVHRLVAEQMAGFILHEDKLKRSDVWMHFSSQYANYRSVLQSALLMNLFEMLM